MINDAGSLCGQAAIRNVLYLVGVVVAVIRIAVPIILVVIGMIDLVKALTSQDDKQIKSATSLLVKRVVIGVVVFLVPTIVSLLMTVIGQPDVKACSKCVTNVWSSGCTWQN